YIAKHGKRKVFHLGSNSSCCQHIQSHYELYKAWCAEKKIQLHDHAMPRRLANAKKEMKKAAK
ncbi:hypothetical protein PAXINDRAFT_55298, partial [Paxillus involutus ATCC 200175]